MYGHLTSKLYKKVQTNLHLIDVQEIHQLEAFSSSPDTTTDVNVIPASMYEQCYCKYSLIQLGSVQARHKVYMSTGMNKIGLCMLYHHVHNTPAHAVYFSVTYMEISVLLSCTDTFTL